MEHTFFHSSYTTCKKIANPLIPLFNWHAIIPLFLVSINWSMVRSHPQMIKWKTLSLSNLIFSSIPLSSYLRSFVLTLCCYKSNMMMSTNYLRSFTLPACNPFHAVCYRLLFLKVSGYDGTFSKIDGFILLEDLYVCFRWSPLQCIEGFNF